MNTQLTDDVESELLQKLHDGYFRFIDLGCGTGESISHCEKQFSLAPGIGFDIDPKKITGAEANGYPALLADVTKQDFPPDCVSFCTMMDFLEHLYSEQDAVNILSRLGHIAKDFLFIRHPNFDDIEYLRSCGFKLDWTHWSGHKNMMTVADYHRVFRSLGWSDYVIIPQKQILNSNHPAIVPLSAPRNTIRYDANLHEPKETVFFSRPVWTQYDIYVRLNPQFDATEWHRIITTSSVDTKNEILKEKLARQYQSLTKARNALTAAKEQAPARGWRETLLAPARAALKKFSSRRQ